MCIILGTSAMDQVVFMCLCVQRVCVFTVYICAHEYINVNVHVCMCILCIQVYTCMCLCVCVHVCVCVCLQCTFVHISI